MHSARRSLPPSCHLSEQFWFSAYKQCASLAAALSLQTLNEQHLSNQQNQQAAISIGTDKESTAFSIETEDPSGLSSGGVSYIHLGPLIRGLTC